MEQQVNTKAIRQALRQYKHIVFIGGQRVQTLPKIYVDKHKSCTTFKACYPIKHFTKNQVMQIQNNVVNALLPCARWVVATLKTQDFLYCPSYVLRVKVAPKANATH